MLHPDIAQVMINDRLERFRAEAAGDRRARRAVNACERAVSHVTARFRSA